MIGRFCRQILYVIVTLGAYGGYGLGLALHLYTVIMAYSGFGFLAAFFSFCCPFLSELAFFGMSVFMGGPVAFYWKMCLTFVGYLVALAVLAMALAATEKE